MTWHTDQISVSDSAPVELYEFVTPQTTYYRTSFQEDYVYGGNTYTAVPTLRSELAVEPTGASHALTIDLPSSDMVISENFTGYPAVPRTSVMVTVYRLQQLSGARVIWWTGPVRGASIGSRGRVAKLTVPDGLEDKLRSDIPRPRLQRLCNHCLYDDMCGVPEAGFRWATSVVAIDGSIILVASHNTAHNYTMGVMLFDGERRSIVIHEVNYMVIDAPFRDMVIGSIIILSRGCDHTVTTCRDAFNNVPNFGGHPQMPLKNPHTVVLRLGD